MALNIIQLQGDLLLSRLNDKNDELKPGDILKVKVVEILNDKVILDLKGKLIPAKTDITLREGEELFLKFQGFSEGQLTLRKIDSEPSLKTDILQTDLERVFKELGLFPTERNLLIGRKLMEFHLPVNRETIQIVNQLLSRLAGPLDNRINAVLHLIKGDIPISEGILETVYSYIQGRPSLGNDISEIERSLQRLEECLQEAAGERKGSEAMPERKQLIEFIEKMRDSLMRMKIELNGGAAVKDLQGKLKAFLEGKHLERFMKLMDEPAMRNNKPASGMVPVSGGEEFEGIGSSKGNSNGEAALSRVKDALVRLVKNLSAESFINSSRETGEENRTIYFQVPLSRDGKWYTSRIKISSNGRGKTKGFNPQKLRISFNIETKNMARVSVELDIKDNRLKGIIGVEREEIRDFLHKNLPLLKTAFEDLRYLFEGIECTVIEPESTAEPLIGKRFLTEKINRVDIKI